MLWPSASVHSEFTTAGHLTLQLPPPPLRTLVRTCVDAIHEMGVFLLEDPRSARAGEIHRLQQGGLSKVLDVGNTVREGG